MQKPSCDKQEGFLFLFKCFVNNILRYFFVFLKQGILNQTKFHKSVLKKAE